MAKIVDREELMKHYGLKLDTTFRWQRNGCPYITQKHGQVHRVFYDLEKVDVWIEERRQNTLIERKRRLAENKEKKRVADSYFVDYPNRPAK